MNYWIFVVTPQKVDSEPYSAKRIYDLRMRDKFWGLGAKTPNRTKVRRGDRIVFYIGRPEMAFAGTATLASDSFQLNSDQKSDLSHGTEYFAADFGVKLTAINSWKARHPMTALVSKLKFVKNPLQWPTYLQGGIRLIQESDYSAITKFSGGLVSTPHQFERFALEAQLESVMARNFSTMSWGAPLQLYKNGEQTGHHFPAGRWDIDFLAVDKQTNQLVAIELKAGKATEAAVVQLLRYMRWVEKNLAEHDQGVRGIIVAHEVDDGLRYAAKGWPNIAVKRYELTVALVPEEF